MTITTLRSIALMTVFSSALMIVLIVIAAGLDVPLGQLQSRAVPLALAAAAGMALIVTLGEPNN